MNLEEYEDEIINELDNVNLNNSVENQIVILNDKEKNRFYSNYFVNDNFCEDDLTKLAEDATGEKENWLSQDIVTLKDMIKLYDEELSKELTPEEMLKFLRSKCFDYDNTLSTIKNLHHLIKTKRELYFQSTVKLSDVFDDKVIYVLPTLVDRHVTIIINPERYNSSKHTYNQILSALFHTIECVLHFELAQITGLNFIIDLQNYKISKLKNFSPLNAKKLAFMLEECFPFRINAVYIVGSKMISHLVYVLNKPFLSQLLRSKIEFTNLNSLHQIYSKDILNKELGGNIDDDLSEKWFAELMRAETFTNSYWNKFHFSNNSNNTDDLNDDIMDKSDNNLLDSQNNCTPNSNASFPFLQILPTCSDYFIPVYK